MCGELLSVYIDYLSSRIFKVFLITCFSAISAANAQGTAYSSVTRPMMLYLNSEQSQGQAPNSLSKNPQLNSHRQMKRVQTVSLTGRGQCFCCSLALRPSMKKMAELYIRSAHRLVWPASLLSRVQYQSQAAVNATSQRHPCRA